MAASGPILSYPIISHQAVPGPPCPPPELVVPCRLLAAGRAGRLSLGKGQPPSWRGEEGLRGRSGDLGKGGRGLQLGPRSEACLPVQGFGWLF